MADLAAGVTAPVPDVGGDDLIPAVSHAELDAEGLFKARPGTIHTWKGHRVDPLNIDPAEVCIEDVAHALARLCRYNGHVAGFLSVARHSLWVSWHLEDHLSLGPDMAFCGLLHDAAETYLSDMPRPLKQADAMVEFRDADARADAAIAQAFGLPNPLPTEVHDADAWVLHNLELHSARDTYWGDIGADEREFLARFERLEAQR